MIEIKDLLLRFENLLVNEEVKKETTSKIIKNITGIEIPTKDIELKDGTLRLNIKPIYRNEIFLKKDRIILELRLELGSRSPGEIR